MILDNADNPETVQGTTDTGEAQHAQTAAMMLDSEHAGVSAITAGTQKRNLSSMLASHEQRLLEVDQKRTCSRSARISNGRQAALRFVASGVFRASEHILISEENYHKQQWVKAFEPVVPGPDAKLMLNGEDWVKFVSHDAPRALGDVFLAAVAAVVLDAGWKTAKGELDDIIQKH
eukprot:3948997-Amphidinium_carterae.1